MGHSCKALLSDTVVGHSCRTLLRDTLVGKVNHHVSKTSVLCETYIPKIKTHSQVCKTSIPFDRTRLRNSSKIHASSPLKSPRQKTADLKKRCGDFILHTSSSHVSTKVSSLFHTNLARHASIQNPLQKLRPMALSSTCERLPTVANG